jgi:hypothetical protein
VQPGLVNDDLTDLTDFLPTLAQAGGLTNLSAYGQLDGLSFYPKMLGKAGKSKKQLYCFYDPENQNKDSLRIWERDKTYKLYDSTGIGKSGKFFNIMNDPKEVKPLDESKLTIKEKTIESNFQLILDTTYSWPDCPVVLNPFSTNITSSSVTIGATIISSGASVLTQSGTSLSTTDEIFLSSSRLIDTNVQPGQFIVTRTGLKPQANYNYIVYAMNNNVSHSTGSVKGVFKTLSRSALKQPTKFTAATNGDSLTVEWNDAVFPETGATKAGYVLLYSTTDPSVIENANGKAPEAIIANGEEIIIPSVKLPLLPPKKIRLPLPVDSNYNFMLIPYTWDGISTATCNYFLKGSLKTKFVHQVIAFK